MPPTQVYLTERQNRGLKVLAARTGSKQSELIWRAVDALLETEGERDWKAALRQACGPWTDRPEVEAELAASSSTRAAVLRPSLTSTGSTTGR